MQEKSLVNSFAVKFDINKEDKMKECLASLSQHSVRSCELHFYNYLPSDEKMQALAMALESNPELKIFKLFDYYNTFKLNTIEIITKSLKNLIHLKGLLYRGALKENTASYFSELIEKTDSLEFLSIGGCRSDLGVLGDNDAELISKALLSNQTLKELHLDLNNIGEKGAKLICAALKVNQKISVLSLEQNTPLRNHEEAIIELIITSTGIDTLTILDLSFSPAQFDRVLKNDSAIEQTIRILRQNPHIKLLALALEKDFIPSDEKLQSLYLALEHLGRLQELEFFRLPSKVIPVISIIAKNNNNLKSLSFNGHINKTSASTFAELIKKNNLEILSLAGLCDEGGKKIGQALADNTSLHTLNLANNGLREESAIAIGTSLKSNKTLTSLNLSSNEIGYNSVQFILDSISINQIVHTLDFRLNCIIFKEETFLRSLQKNPQLKSLELLKYPGAINPKRSNYDWGFYSDRSEENTISFNAYCKSRIIIKKEYQKVLFLKFLCFNNDLFPKELFQFIYYLFIVNLLGDDLQLALTPFQNNAAKSQESSITNSKNCLFSYAAQKKPVPIHLSSSKEEENEDWGCFDINLRTLFYFLPIVGWFLYLYDKCYASTEVLEESVSLLKV
ncbi:MAG: hypothetical protein H0U73_00195 [Tatlockia sp.]|nr:hypothetical protein [Tatlockia sp.]